MLQKDQKGSNFIEFYKNRRHTALLGEMTGAIVLLGTGQATFMALVPCRT
jgi:hypothetical protein